MTKKIFSILIILLPILYQYKSPVTIISLGESYSYHYADMNCYEIEE